MCSCWVSVFLFLGSSGGTVVLLVAHLKSHLLGDPFGLSFLKFCDVQGEFGTAMHIV